MRISVASSVNASALFTSSIDKTLTVRQLRASKKDSFFLSSVARHSSSRLTIAGTGRSGVEETSRLFHAPSSRGLCRRSQKGKSDLTNPSVQKADPHLRCPPYVSPLLHTKPGPSFNIPDETLEVISTAQRSAIST
ncbi:hypothetical protein F2Q69_00057200 [Brassica cretica]|uniref:Uncharacterized protein n=1 Tax=Brassica cretica TaxID=69181 RepID=A0A8S9N832_BRACR|nr:hypothetical protein F2Q69_00057200 [Brassica cretica]